MTAIFKANINFKHFQMNRNQELYKFSQKQELKTFIKAFFSLLGCHYTWSSQPNITSKISIGNVLVTAATEFAGISFTSLHKFANLLNLKFFGSSTYYNHRRDYIYPEVDHAWIKNQVEQVDEIVESGRSLNLAADGQCDSPGHNAAYNTVTMMDTHTNKVLAFKVVHVEVSDVIFIFQTLLHTCKAFLL